MGGEVGGHVRRRDGRRDERRDGSRREERREGSGEGGAGCNHLLRLEAELRREDHRRLAPRVPQPAVAPRLPRGGARDAPSRRRRRRSPTSRLAERRSARVARAPPRHRGLAAAGAAEARGRPVVGVEPPVLLLLLLRRLLLHEHVEERQVVVGARRVAEQRVELQDLVVQQLGVVQEARAHLGVALARREIDDVLRLRHRWRRREMRRERREARGEERGEARGEERGEVS